MRRSLLATVMFALAFLAHGGPAAAATEDMLTIEVAYGGNGTVVPSGSVLVPRGGSQRFEFSADGCLGSYPQVDGVPVDSIAGYTFTNVQDDHTLYVFFDRPRSTTTLTATTLDPVCVAPDTLVAHVNAGAGLVQFFEAGAPIGTAPLIAGEARFPLTPPVVGSHGYTANFLGDPCAQPSSSDLVYVEVVPATLEDVEVNLVALPLTFPNIAELRLSLTAGGQPLLWLSGSVEIYGNDNYIQSFPLSHGSAVATFTVPFYEQSYRCRITTLDGCVPPIWTDAVVFEGRVVNCGWEHVGVQFDLSQDPVMVGQTSVFTATFSPSSTTGFVDFGVAYLGTLGRGSIVDGVASFPFVPSMPGSFTFYANYQGDGLHECFAYTGPTLSVIGAGTTTSHLSIAAEPNRVLLGEPSNLIAHVDPPGATGSVEFSDRHGFRVDAPLVNGVAAITLPSSIYGAHHYRARYHGDTQFAASLDSTLFEVVSDEAVPRVVTSPNPSLPGQPITLHAILDSPMGVGMMTFIVDEVALAPTLVVGGLATQSLSLPAGVHSISAGYSLAPLDASNIVLQDVTSTPPSDLRVESPNGGETLVVGTSTELRWNPVDAGLAPSVELRLQRAPSEPWETIAQVANTGAYSWMVTGPGTNDGPTAIRSARFAVLDPASQVPSDTSDTEFWLSDPTTLATGSSGAPAAFALGSPRPNPARAGISCDFALPREAPVKLTILDVTGRLVAVVADGTHAAGRHVARWDGRSSGGAAPPGVYLLRYETPDATVTRHILIVR